MQSLTFLYDKNKAAERQRQALSWLADRVRWERVLADLRVQENRQAEAA